MTLLALLLALAQQPAQPINSPQDQTVGRQQPGANAEPKKSASSNATDKAESLPTEHYTDLQGGPGKKSAKHANNTKSKKAQGKKKAQSNKAQGRSAKPLPEASPAPTPQNEAAERSGGQGKGRQQPKPLGEKSNQ
jgi:hypothetical protein